MTWASGTTAKGEAKADPSWKLVSAAELIKEGSDEPLGIEGYAFSSDGRRLLIAGLAIVVGTLTMIDLRLLNNFQGPATEPLLAFNPGADDMNRFHLPESSWRWLLKKVLVGRRNAPLRPV